jgi:hypothetical protein
LASSRLGTLARSVSADRLMRKPGPSGSSMTAASVVSSVGLRTFAPFDRDRQQRTAKPGCSLVLRPPPSLIRPSHSRVSGALATMDDALRAAKGCARSGRATQQKRVQPFPTFLIGLGNDRSALKRTLGDECPPAIDWQSFVARCARARHPSLRSMSHVMHLGREGTVCLRVSSF